jgi:hypothetical protein
MPTLTSSHEVGSWNSVLIAVRGKCPLIIVLEGQAAELLVTMRLLAAEEGIRWREGGAPGCIQRRPFDYIRVLTDLYGPDQPGEHVWSVARRDSDSPVDRDPVAVYKALAKWFEKVSADATIAVVPGLEYADWDSLEALRFVARSAANQKWVLILSSQESLSSPQVDQITRMQNETNVVRVQGRPGVEVGSTFVRTDFDAQTGIEFCRAGAIHMGSTVLLQQLRPDHVQTALPGMVLEGWQCLAMAMLRKREYECAAVASRQALDLAASLACRHLARRTLMLALRAMEESQALMTLGMAALAESQSTSLNATERTWLLLDAALGLSPFDQKQAHDECLDQILAFPESTVSIDCLAAAHVWRASSYFVEEDVERTCEHLQAGALLLARAKEYSRLNVVQAKLGAVLFVLGAFREAAIEFEASGWHAMDAGNFTFAASSIGDAISAKLLCGDLIGAEALLATPTKLKKVIWKDQLAAVIRRRSQIAIAACRREPVRDAIIELVDDVGNLSCEMSAWIPRLISECMFILADIAMNDEDFDGAAGWVDKGLELARKTPIEDRLLLLASGRPREVRLQTNRM